MAVVREESGTLIGVLSKFWLLWITVQHMYSTVHLQTNSASPQSEKPRMGSDPPSCISTCSLFCFEDITKPRIPEPKNLWINYLATAQSLLFFGFWGAFGLWDSFYS